MVRFTPGFSRLPRRQVTLGPLQGHSCHCLRLWGPQDTTRAMMCSLMALAPPLGLSDTRLSKRQPQQRIWEQRTRWLPPKALAPCAQPSRPPGSPLKAGQESLPRFCTFALHGHCKPPARAPRSPGPGSLGSHRPDGPLWSFGSSLPLLDRTVLDLKMG